MKDARAAILLAILLVMVAGYMFRPQIEAYYLSHLAHEGPPKPLDGKNEIKSLSVAKKENGTYWATIEYFYRGDGQLAYINLIPSNGEESAPVVKMSAPLERGNHTIKMEVTRPLNNNDVMVTRKITARLWTEANSHSEKQVDYLIEWPDMSTYFALRDAPKKSNDTIYNEAVASIDTESQEGFNIAKKNLELILLRDPKYVAAYPELARIAMKSNWGPEGWRQAESYLLSGLSIDPKNANVKVLLGYIYAHQKRYQEAEAEFKDATEIGTKNLWLWTNWGELLSMQNKNDQALEKYMLAIDAGRTFDTYDRARMMAYRFAFPILENKKQLEKLDALYKRRAEEFDKMPFFYADYGRFRLTHYDDYESGILYAKKALENGCECDEAKYTLGMSYYIAWTKLNGDEKNNAFNQANIFLPNGPKSLYQMARFQETSNIIPALIKAGWSMRSQDNEKYNAMSYALYADDVEAAQRLAKNGASFNDPITEQQYPVGLVAFQRENIKAIKMMKNNGVNFTALKFNGMSAVDYARRLNNKEIIDIVESGAKYKI